MYSHYLDTFICVADTGSFQKQEKECLLVRQR